MAGNKDKAAKAAAPKAAASGAPKAAASKGVAVSGKETPREGPPAHTARWAANISAAAQGAAEHYPN